MKKSIPPHPGTNIYTLWNDVLSDIHYLTTAEIKQSIIDNNHKIPIGSFHTHLTDLLNRRYVEMKMINGQKRYKRTYGNSIEDLATKANNLAVVQPSNANNKSDDPFIAYLQDHIGQTIFAKDMKILFTPSHNGAWDRLNKLAIAGYILKKRKAEGMAYKVLPKINTYSRSYNKSANIKEKRIKEKKVEQQELLLNKYTSTDAGVPDISKMSLGDILTNMIALRDENLRLKHALENIVNLVVQAGVVEEI